MLSSALHPVKIQQPQYLGYFPALNYRSPKVQQIQINTRKCKEWRQLHHVYDNLALMIGYTQSTTYIDDRQYEEI